MRRACFILRLALFLAMASALRAQTTPPARTPLEEWLNEPERHLPGWTVRVNPPFLTFQLRMAVVVRANADLDKFKALGHDLHFLVKIADSTGKWLPQRRHSSMQKIPGRGYLLISERFFAKPGDYQIAFVVYDATSRNHGVWKLPVHVAADPSLPPLSLVPAIQFVEANTLLLPGGTPEMPAIQNERPLRLDVIVNLTERSELELGERHDLAVERRLSGFRGPLARVLPEWELGLGRQNFTTLTLLSIADLISSVKLNGCIRISATDAVRSRVLLDRRNYLNSFTLLSNLLDRRNTDKVDAQTLIQRQQAGTFLHDYLQTVVADDSGCSPSQRQTDRAIVLISDALLFPEAKQLIPLAPPTVGPGITHFYLFRMTVPELFRQIRSAAMVVIPDDQVVRLMSSLGAHRYDLTQPKDFQHALPKFLAELNHLEAAHP